MEISGIMKFSFEICDYEKGLTISIKNLTYDLLLEIVNSEDVINAFKEYKYYMNIAYDKITIDNNTFMIISNTKKFVNLVALY